MVSLKDYNLEVIRDFSEEQFTAHIKLIEAINSENDFGDIGVKALLKNYLELLYKIQKEHVEQKKQEFRLTTLEVMLYDLVVEIARLCYKHSCNTSVESNDWEEEFH